MPLLPSCSLVLKQGLYRGISGSTLKLPLQAYWLFLRKCSCLEAMGNRYSIEMPHPTLGQLEGLMGECGLLPLDSSSAWLSCLSQTSEIARLRGSPEASRAVRLSGNHSASLPCIEAARADLAFCDQCSPWVCVSGMLASSSPWIWLLRSGPVALHCHLGEYVIP